MTEVANQFNHFIGIDIGKFEFAVHCYGEKNVQMFANSSEGWELFEDAFKYALNQKTLVVLETTGGYEKGIIYYLLSKNIAVHRANTRKIKNYIRSFGIMGKTDKIDAKALSCYAAERHANLELYTAPDRVNDQLRILVARRQDLVKIQTQEKNRLQAPDNTVVQVSINDLLKILSAQITKLDEEITKLVASSPALQLKIKTLEEIPGIGPVVAVQLLANIPELGTLTGKKVASISGVAPHPYESGTYKGYRKTRGGRKNVKPILCLAAMSATRSKSRFGEYYNKLIGTGKKPMVALTALMRKIIVVANAKIRDLAYV